jgi:GT2 family glycosyltransferase
MKAYIGIATSGRETVLSDTLRMISAQIHQPDAVFVCRPKGEEGPATQSETLNLVNLSATKGSCAQRNAILDVLQGEDCLLLIIDDDFILHPDYLNVLLDLMSSAPDIALINGRLIADGIIGPGLSVAAAKALIETEAKSPKQELKIIDIPTAYGCNMAVNLNTVRNLRFDESLPLYGWQEDVDFSVRLKGLGRIVKITAPAGVHLGIKTGRTSGVRFGYSQVVNPIYLLRKGTMRFSKAAWLINKNIAMNVFRSVWSEPYLDRRGRLKGNLIGLADILRGKGRPDRICEF